jgi:hypothetical protein
MYRRTDLSRDGEENIFRGGGGKYDRLGRGSGGRGRRLGLNTDLADDRQR